MRDVECLLDEAIDDEGRNARGHDRAEAQGEVKLFVQFLSAQRFAGRGIQVGDFPDCGREVAAQMRD